MIRNQHNPMSHSTINTIIKLKERVVLISFQNHLNPLFIYFWLLFCKENTFLISLENDFLLTYYGTWNESEMAVSTVVPKALNGWKVHIEKK